MITTLVLASLMLSKPVAGDDVALVFCSDSNSMSPELKKDKDLVEQSFAVQDRLNGMAMAKAITGTVPEPIEPTKGALFARLSSWKSAAPKTALIYLSGVGSSDPSGSPVLLSSKSTKKSSAEDISLLEVVAAANELSETGTRVTLFLDSAWAPRSGKRALEVRSVGANKYFDRKGSTPDITKTLASAKFSVLASGAGTSYQLSYREDQHEFVSAFTLSAATYVVTSLRSGFSPTYFDLKARLQSTFHFYERLGYLDQKPLTRNLNELGDQLVSAQPASATTDNVKPVDFNLLINLEQAKTSALSVRKAYERMLEDLNEQTGKAIVDLGAGGSKPPDRWIEVGISNGVFSAKIRGDQADELGASDFKSESPSALFDGELKEYILQESAFHRMFWAPEAARKVPSADLVELVGKAGAFPIYNEGDSFQVKIKKLPTGWKKAYAFVMERSSLDGIIHLTLPEPTLMLHDVGENGALLPSEEESDRLEILASKEATAEDPELVEVRVLLIRADDPDSESKIDFARQGLANGYGTYWNAIAKQVATNVPDSNWTWCRMRYQIR